MNTINNDFIDALKKFSLWTYLGGIEVKQKYRRSVIGPWWITISMIIFILAMSLVFSRLFKQDLKLYLPSFTAGYLFWTFFSSSIAEATETFKNNSGFIKQIHLSHLVYIFKHLTKHSIIFAHNSIVYFLVCLICDTHPGIKVFLFFPGLLLFVLNLFWITLIVSIICARFRDMTPIVSSFLQIAFFVTPISWSSNLLANGSLILKLNPLSHLIGIVKLPLIGETPSAGNWIVTIAGAVLGNTLALAIYSRKKNLIPFWIN